MSFLHRLANSICQTPLQQLSVQVQQVRTTFVRAVMYRDYRRRQIVKHYAKERLRINSLRKNSILPSEIQHMADEEIAALPRDSCPVRLVDRCCLTSRAHWQVHRYRMNRIMWRHLADHNQLSGVQRAMW